MILIFLFLYICFITINRPLMQFFVTVVFFHIFTVYANFFENRYVLCLQNGSLCSVIGGHIEFLKHLLTHKQYV